VTGGGQLSQLTNVQRRCPGIARAGLGILDRPHLEVPQDADDFLPLLDEGDDKLEAINLKRMKKRFKAPAFTKGANREQMQECSKMGVELDDFLVTCLTAMQEISEQLGL
jgi:hypothetical protein